jgi:hypothetical protein
MSAAHTSVVQMMDAVLTLPYLGCGLIGLSPPREFFGYVEF